MSTYPFFLALLFALQSPTFSQLASQADTARSENRLNDAVLLYHRALALKPSWAEGWFSLGTIQYDQSNYQEAADALRHAATLTPRSGTPRIFLGLCEFELGQSEAALKDIQAGEKLGAADEENLRHVAFYHEGVLLQRKGQFEEAQKALDTVCRDGAEGREVALAQGLVALRLRDETASGDTEPVALAVGHAECLSAQKKFPDAQAAFAEALKQFPQFPNIYYAYGRLLLNGPDPNAAIPEFQREINLHPNHVLARLQIAAIQYKVDSAAGLPYAQAAVKLDPAMPFGHYLLGVLLLDTGDYQRAIPELETARKSLPTDSRIYYSLGLAYSRAGRTADAARARAEFQRLTKNRI